MKVFLQSLVNLKFLGMNGDWTSNPDEAMDFSEVTRAVNTALIRHLGNVRVVIKFPEPMQDVALPPVKSGRHGW